MYVYMWGGSLTEYSVSGSVGQADYRPDIQSVDERVRRITVRIFGQCMSGSGGLSTGYSFSV